MDKCSPEGFRITLMGDIQHLKLELMHCDYYYHYFFLFVQEWAKNPLNVWLLLLHSPLQVVFCCSEDQSVMNGTQSAYLQITFEFQEARGQIRGRSHRRRPEQTASVCVAQISDFPSPKITATFPFLNISADICHSFDRKQFANKPQIKTREWPSRGQEWSLSVCQACRLKSPFLNLASHLKSTWSYCLQNRWNFFIITQSWGSFLMQTWAINLKLNLPAANKWSQKCLPTLLLGSLQMDVKNALNLVCKICHGGDDRKEPKTGDWIIVKTKFSLF